MPTRRATPSRLMCLDRRRAGALFLLIVITSGCTREANTDSAKDGPRTNDSAKNGETSARSSEPAATGAATAARFVEVAKSGGIDFTYRNGEEAGLVSILESLGGGVGLLDYDIDGALDIFLSGGGSFTEARKPVGAPSALFRGVKPLAYQDVSSRAGIGESTHYSHAATVADFDNDGFPDVLVTGYGGVSLHHNKGDGTFAEEAIARGLNDRSWSSSAAWGDLNGDGNPDLYIAHYVDWSLDNDPFCAGPDGVREICPPRRFQPLPDSLYFSNGDGTFRDGTSDAGLRDDGKGLGVLIADADLDGRLDVYVSNDTVANFLYRGSGDGRLEDASVFSGTALSDRGLPDGSMGIDLGDYDQDGLPDLWVANYENESFALYRNRGDFFFQHVSRAAGVTVVGANYVGWGTAFLDFDHDGDEDLFVSNGHVIRYPTSAPLRQKPLLFQNDGGRFRNVADAAGEYTNSQHMGRGLAAGDLDGDGDLDLVISHINEPVAVLKNESTEGTTWAGLRLIGRGSSRDAVGALVSLRSGKARQTRQRKGGGSYASSHDPRIFFGLNGATRVEEVEIRWPSGIVQILQDIPVGQFTTVVEPAHVKP